MTTPRRDDRDVDTAVRGWLRDDDEPTMDRNRHIGRIMGRVDETRQRRRLWPLNPFGRRAVHSATGTDGASGSGRAILAPARLLTAAVLVTVVTAGALAVAVRPASPTLLPGALPADPADEALFERLGAVWLDDDVDAATVLEAYAPDAVHTVLWTDTTERFVGADEIAARIRDSLGLLTDTSLVRLPDSLPFGERRYLELNPTFGGWPCVYWIADEGITRHDCILPKPSRSGMGPRPGDPPTDVTRMELTALLAEGWQGDRQAMEQAVAPDIIHMVAFDDETRTVSGADAYWWTAQSGGLKAVIPPIDLPAPEGELRWVDYSTVAGGSLCTFWADEGQVTRHDCIVPSHTPDVSRP